MELATVDIIIILGFLVTVTVIGFVMSRVAAQGVEDYFLGGNRIPWYVLGISTATSNFDMAGTMIIVAMVFSLGYKGFLVELRGGVGLSLAFLMIFLGKWLRRSRVMTSAEWMKLRFGTDRSGKAAHLLSAIANIILSLGMIIYFSKGAGKFLVHFIPLSEVTCTTIMVLVGLGYTLLSGLYGVVFTDVLQMFLLTFTAIYISFKAFAITGDVSLPLGFLDLDLEPVKAPLGQALMKKDPTGWGSIFPVFGLCVFTYLLRTSMEGVGGVGGYTDQRFFAARTEREAGLLTLESIVLSLFRWTMVAGLVVMGFQMVQSGGPQAEVVMQDPENLLPIVLGQLLPAGIKGLVIAGLIAAAMSTFDSTLNAGASYVVKDVYHTYIKPDASSEDLMWVSRVATISLCVLGVAFAAVVPNINQIWGLITMGLGAGLFVPLALRWYWPRFTGWGFAAGTGAGMLAGLVTNSLSPLPLYQAFPITVGTALVTSVVVSLLTPATNDHQLVRFYVQVNPWGFWRRVENLATEQGHLEPKSKAKRFMEKVYDGLALALAIPFQLSLLLAGMSFIFHDWEKFGIFAASTVFASVGLYFFWFRNLKDTEECSAEDDLYRGLALDEPLPTAEPSEDSEVN